MTRLAWPALFLLAIPAGFAAAGDPPVPSSGAPAVGYGQVVVKDDKVVLALRQLDMVATAELRTVTTTVMQTRQTAQGPVVEAVPVTRTMHVTVMKPKAWRTVYLPLDAKGLSVTDLAGDTFTPLKLAEKLAKETPVLVAADEAPDAHYLRATAPGTLIVTAPAPLLGQGTAAPPELYPPGVGGVRPMIRMAPKAIILQPAPK